MPAEEVTSEKSTLSPCCDSHPVAVRRAQPRDARAIWELVRDTPSLDTNSCYAYLVLCDHFRETCCVAEIDGHLAGFVTGFIPPNQPHVVFVWQIAVAGWAQKKGVANKLLHHLVESLKGRGVTQLHATITPSNDASQRLFTAFARQVGAVITNEACYSPSDLGEPAHEAEHLFQIGPLPTNCHHINSTHGTDN